MFVPAGAAAGAGSLMDFALTDEQLRRLRGGDRALLRAWSTPSASPPSRRSDERIDRDLWRALADADLLGLAVPEADGGAGYGLMELCLLLEAQGNAVAPVPLWATLVLGALPDRPLRLGGAARPLAARRRAPAT